MDKYRISKTIGQGSYGTVYKATPKNSEQVVALKVITKVCWRLLTPNYKSLGLIMLSIVLA